MPGPPHPGGGGDPGQGPPPHRCCGPSTAGKALGVEVGVQGPSRPPTDPQPGTEDSLGCARQQRLGEGGLGLATPPPWCGQGSGRKTPRGCCVKRNKEKPEPSSWPSGVSVSVGRSGQPGEVAGRRIASTWRSPPTPPSVRVAARGPCHQGAPVELGGSERATWRGDARGTAASRRGVGASGR